MSCCTLLLGIMALALYAAFQSGLIIILAGLVRSIFGDFLKADKGFLTTTRRGYVRTYEHEWTSNSMHYTSEERITLGGLMNPRSTYEYNRCVNLTDKIWRRESPTLIAMSMIATALNEPEPKHRIYYSHKLFDLSRCKTVMGKYIVIGVPSLHLAKYNQFYEGHLGPCIVIAGVLDKNHAIHVKSFTFNLRQLTYTVIDLNKIYADPHEWIMKFTKHYWEQIIFGVIGASEKEYYRMNNSMYKRDGGKMREYQWQKFMPKGDDCTCPSYNYINTKVIPTSPGCGKIWTNALYGMVLPRGKLGPRKVFEPVHEIREELALTTTEEPKHREDLGDLGLNTDTMRSKRDLRHARVKDLHLLEFQQFGRREESSYVTQDVTWRTYPSVITGITSRLELGIRDVNNAVNKLAERDVDQAAIINGLNENQIHIAQGLAALEANEIIQAQVNALGIRVQESLTKLVTEISLKEGVVGVSHSHNQILAFIKEEKSLSEQFQEYNISLKKLKHASEKEINITNLGDALLRQHPDFQHVKHSKIKIITILEVAWIISAIWISSSTVIFLLAWFYGKHKGTNSDFYKWTITIYRISTTCWAMYTTLVVLIGIVISIFTGIKLILNYFKHFSFF